MKTKVQYFCNECGAIFPKWQGQCMDCQAWNSLTEERVTPISKNAVRTNGYANAVNNNVVLMADIALEQQERRPST